jgi:hypothetical protein
MGGMVYGETARFICYIRGCPEIGPWGLLSRCAPSAISGAAKRLRLVRFVTRCDDLPGSTVALHAPGTENLFGTARAFETAARTVLAGYCSEPAKRPTGHVDCHFNEIRATRLVVRVRGPSFHLGDRCVLYRRVSLSAPPLSVQYHADRPG